MLKIYGVVCRGYKVGYEKRSGLFVGIDPKTKLQVTYGNTLKEIVTECIEEERWNRKER